MVDVCNKRWGLYEGKMDVTEKVRAGCMHGERERWVTWEEGHGTISKGNLVVYLGITMYVAHENITTIGEGVVIIEGCVCDATNGGRRG